ncbi:MAG: cation diffusion facilitator family transporter, partial [Methylocystis sp.]|nr:cation diffusion facilitator family transporter [Methylocystis sp.]
AYGVLGVSILIDFVRSYQLSRIAKEEHSDALAADALHFTSDLVSSVLVVMGLVATHFGFMEGDAIASFGVAAFIAVAGYRLGQRTISTLLDAAPRDLAPQIERAIRATPGVIALENLRLRSVGADVIGEATIAVARNLRVEQAAAIKTAVADAIAAVAPRAAVTLAVESRALDDETVMERAMLVAARRHLPAYHILAHQVGERLAIGLDLEFDGAMPISRAHAIATNFEAAIRDEFGPDVEIETHIEPREPHVLTGRDADPSVVGSLAQALTRLAAGLETISDVHNVRVRETAGGLIVNYHCRVQPAASVDAVHAAVDEIERRVREEYPGILRIVGHAEPVDH